MSKVKIISSSVAESIKIILKNKRLFLLLFLLQIAFFIALSSINVVYGSKIVESNIAITEYFKKLQIDELSVTSNILEQKSPLGDDPLLISRHFNEMVKNLRIYLIYAFVSMLASASFGWTLTHKIVHGMKGVKLKEVFFRTFIVSLCYLGLIFLFFFSVFSISLTESLTVAAFFFTKYLPFLIISIIRS